MSVYELSRPLLALYPPVLAAVLVFTPVAAKDFDCKHFVDVELQIANDAQASNLTNQARRHNAAALTDQTFETGRIVGMIEELRRLQVECQTKEEPR